MKEQKKIEINVEILLANHLFDPTDKLKWIDVLIKKGLTEEEAKHAYKIAANRYHVSRTEQKNKKSNLVNETGKIATHTGIGILTFLIGPWIYLFFVIIILTIVFFIFGL